MSKPVKKRQNYLFPLENNLCRNSVSLFSFRILWKSYIFNCWFE